MEYQDENFKSIIRSIAHKVMARFGFERRFYDLK